MPKANLFALLVFALLLQSCATLPKPDICNERAGRVAMSAKQYDVAYTHLKGCEKLDKASGEAYSQLAVLTEAGYGTYESDDARHTKYYELMHRAALKLELNALAILIDFYKDGDALLLPEPRITVARCLNDLLDSGEGNKRQVLTCLSL